MLNEQRYDMGIGLKGRAPQSVSPTWKDEIKGLDGVQVLEEGIKSLKISVTSQTKESVQAILDEYPGCFHFRDVIPRRLPSGSPIYFRRNNA